MVRNPTVARRWVRAAGLVSALCLLTGCNPHFTHGLVPPKYPLPALSETGRGTIEPDVSALPIETAGKPPERPARYLRLTADECRVLAIRNAPFADDLDSHPDNAPPKHPLCQTRRQAESARASALVRGYAADESRNRAASEALDEFFQLAQAEGQFDLLVQAHHELLEQYRAAEEVVAQGLRDRAGVDELRVQVLDVEAQMARLTAGSGQLNAALRARLGLPAGERLPLWPEDPLRVQPEDPDIEQAVAIGLKARPDLNGLRVLLNEPGGEDLMRAVLAGANPLLAVAKAAGPVGMAIAILCHKAKTDAEAMRRSVASLLAARERQADAEIRAAVANLHGAKAVVVARAAEVRRQAGRVADLEKRHQAGLQVAAELIKARLDLLKAKGDLIKAAAEWNIAGVKLRQATGMLVRE